MNTLKTSTTVLTVEVKELVFIVSLKSSVRSVAEAVYAFTDGRYILVANVILLGASIKGLQLLR